MQTSYLVGLLENTLATMCEKDSLVKQKNETQGNKTQNFTLGLLGDPLLVIRLPRACITPTGRLTTKHVGVLASLFKVVCVYPNKRVK